MKKSVIVFFLVFVTAVVLTVIFFPTPQHSAVEEYQIPAMEATTLAAVQVGERVTPTPKPTTAPTPVPPADSPVVPAEDSDSPGISSSPAATPSIDIPRPTPTPKPSFPPATEPVVDTSETGNAVVVARYYSDNGKRIKVRLSRGSKTYTYDLQPDNMPVRYPLNMGTGDYGVEFLENVSGSQYRSIYKSGFSASWDGQNTPFLQSIQMINWDPSMEPIIDALLFAMQTGDAGKTQAIYEELASTLQYDFDVFLNKSLPAGYIPDIERTYRTRLGVCYDMSSLLASMLRSVGVPTKLRMGYSDDIDGYHAWNEVLVDENWVVVDLTIDSIFREKDRGYSFAKNTKNYSPDKEY